MADSLEVGDLFGRGRGAFTEATAPTFEGWPARTATRGRPAAEAKQSKDGKKGGLGEKPIVGGRFAMISCHKINIIDFKYAR